MAKEMTLSGCAAAAQAVRVAKVDVICSFPIRPYTATMMELAKMVANGELDAEFVHGEGEHGQLSVCYGASAAGRAHLHGELGRRRDLRLRDLLAHLRRSPPGADDDRRPGARSAGRLRIGAHRRHVGARPGLAHGLVGDAAGGVRQPPHQLPHRRGRPGDVAPVRVPGRLLRLAHPGQGGVAGPGAGGRVLAPLQAGCARARSEEARIARPANPPRPGHDHGPAACAGVPGSSRRSSGR